MLLTTMLPVLYVTAFAVARAAGDLGFAARGVDADWPLVASAALAALAVAVVVIGFAAPTRRRGLRR